jgi:hypothetical protein
LDAQFGPDFLELGENRHRERKLSDNKGAVSNDRLVEFDVLCKVFKHEDKLVNAISD